MSLSPISAIHTPDVSEPTAAVAAKARTPQPVAPVTPDRLRHHQPSRACGVRRRWGRKLKQNLTCFLSLPCHLLQE